MNKQLLFIDLNQENACAAEIELSKLICKQLADCGYQVRSCHSAQSAFADFINDRPDAVLINHRADPKKLLQLIDAISHYEYDLITPIIALFAETESDDKSGITIEQAMQHPAINDAIMAPITLKLLQQRLAFILKNAGQVVSLSKQLEQADFSQQLARLGSWQWSASNDVIQADSMAFELMCLPPQNCSDKKAFFANIQQQDQSLVEQAIVDAQHGKKQIDFSFRVKHHHNKTLHIECLARAHFDEQQKLIGLNGTLQDISNLHISHELVDYQSHFDTLTELPNRQYFNELLQQHVQEQPMLSTAVVVLDIDRFHQFNSEIGNLQSDKLLQTLAQRLSKIIREGDIAARLGSNEFAILAGNFNNLDELCLFMTRLFADINAPFIIDKQEKLISYSLGVSLIPEDAHNAEDALNHANLACSQAKQQGGNRYEFYHADMKLNTENILQLEMDLRRALEREELELYYQPQVDALSLKPVGAEALIRWNHAKHGLISPASFIPLAEATGLIEALGDYALNQAIKQTAEWHKQGHPITIGINLSSKQFNQNTLIGQIQNAIEKSGLASQYIDLEITETLAMNDAEHNIAILNCLKALGVKLSIDDFGTGYSSLSYLHRFPVDHLKIDRAFVQNLDQETGQSLARTILSMAQSLQLTVIAEGIENKTQETFLQKHGCQILQGYKYGKPMQKEAFTDWLNHYNMQIDL